MARRVITAPEMDLVDRLEGPLIYLAGPIQGTSHWQAEAIAILDELAPDVHVASPRATRFAGGVERHLAWEQRFMARAAKGGAILFWCAKETSHRCDRSYAAQMRFDLGEWTVKSSLGLARLVVGIERGFTGGPYLQRRYALNYPHVPVCRSLRQACAAAVELAYREIPQVLYPRTLEDLFVPQNFSFKISG